MRKQKRTKRDIFAELMEGIAAMKAHREGKITPKPLPRRTPAILNREVPRDKVS